MMQIHHEPHPFARQDAVITATGFTYQVEDYWDRVSGGSWMFAEGDPACLKYALRIAGTEIPLDDEVVYGKIDGLGHLYHVSELTFPVRNTR